MRTQPRTIACILAGGLSSRLGREKSQVRLGNRTLLSHIKRTVASVGLPLTVLRRDIVPRCGPLGGIYTALKTLDADSILFLACDMPLVSPELLSRLLKAHQRGGRAVFVELKGQRGFPAIVSGDSLGTVEQQIQRKEWSVQRLSRTLKAVALRIPKRDSAELLNVNTPADLALARSLFKEAR
jgi:molybdenum cofactor guanylyltransferase